VIDLHSHILSGVDDGCASLAESIALARASLDDGVRAIAATPHVRSDYSTPADVVNRLVDELRAKLREAGVPLTVLPGGEIGLDCIDRIDAAELRSYGLGGSQYVLLEFPYSGWPLALEGTVLRMAAAGLRAVVAHPERNAEVRAQPGRLERLVEVGALVQVTAASLDGRAPRAVERTARLLVERGLAHLIASDAHGSAVRAPGLSTAAGSLGDDELGRWLTRDVPAAIVAGEDLPRRPGGHGSKRPWWRFGPPPL
jgi:protein-tyrosine phosphatase